LLCRASDSTHRSPLEFVNAFYKFDVLGGELVSEQVLRSDRNVVATAAPRRVPRREPRSLRVFIDLTSRRRLGR